MSSWCRPAATLIATAALATVLATVLAGCTQGVTVEQFAAEHFEAFQTALFARDRAGLRKLVCRDAREAVRDLCQVDLHGRQPLIVTGVSRDRHEYRVHVRDPNPGAAVTDSFYVLAREDGELRVDLLATAAYHQHSTGPGRSVPSFARGRLTPGQLTPGQIARARGAMPAEPGR